MAKEGNQLHTQEYFGARLSHLTNESTEEEIVVVYDDWASDYDHDFIDVANCRNHKPLVELLDAAIQQVSSDKRKNELRILDVGAGTGLVGEELRKLGFTTVDALDISQGMLNEAKKKGVYDKFICAYLTEKKIAEIGTGEYDGLVCNGSLTLGHVGPSAFVEMIRMVKAGGLICFGIRIVEMEVYRGKIEELENQQRWKKVSETELPFYDKGNTPRPIHGMVYQVLK